MSDRRVLLGTGAVIVGVGSALLTGSGVAAADTTDTDPGSTAATASAETSASTSGTKARRATTRAKDAAPATSTASSETAQQAPAARGTGRVSPERVRRAAKNTSPVTDSPNAAAP
ncbi:MAG: hypothetical protein NT146_00040, partial [Mycobacterium sp.]|nr:hypothetical protein [Mycobacterium sp.]